MRTRFVRPLLFVLGMLFLSTASFAQVGVSITIAPPALPTYEQPVCPGDGYIWTPGYWAWGNDEYYWVPGTWVLPPEVGFLWTPGYWGWGGNGFLFNEGYWGTSVGFYGGINYGFGYFGHGYEGGRWDNGHFFYNTAVNRVNASVIHNVYNTRTSGNTANRLSYNGGNGGINARATAQEEAVARGRHIPPVAAQTQHAWTARNDPQQRVSSNHGTPPVAATARPNIASHPKDLPPIERPTPPPNAGNSQLDQKHQQQQEKLVAQQNQDRQTLQRKQDDEHQQLAKQNAAQPRMQQMEQQHQQQTQQLQQRHTQQMQQMQQRAGGGGSHGGGGGRR